jgi:hypothetical protein
VACLCPDEHQGIEGDDHRAGLSYQMSIPKGWVAGVGLGFLGLRFVGLKGECLALCENAWRVMCAIGQCIGV